MGFPSTVVPAYPYEGALYWFLNESTRHSLEHPYYGSLYGANPEIVAARAAALVSLFEDVRIGPADHTLPDWETYSTGDSYVHPQLRLSVALEDQEWSEEGDALAERVWREQLLGDLFANHQDLRDPLFQRHFIVRILQQTRM